MRKLGRYQFSLKSALATVLCLCVGLAATTRSLQSQPGTSWISDTGWLRLIFDVCVSAVAVGIVIGLLQQVVALRNSIRSNDESRPDLSFAVAWRLLIAAILASSIVLEIAIIRGFLNFSQEDLYFGYYGPIIPYALIDLCVIVVLSTTPSLPLGNSKPKFPRLMKSGFLVICSFILVVGAIREELLSIYLTYKAIADIEANHTLQFRRPGAYVDQQSVGYWFSWLALAAFVSCLLGASLWLWSIRNRTWSTATKIVTTLTGLLFVSVSAAYGYWFLLIGFPTLAPDFAEAGLQSKEQNWLEAGLLLCVAIPVAAYRIVKNPSESRVLEFGDRKKSPFFHLDSPMLCVGFLGGCCYFISLILMYLFDQDMWNFSFAQKLWWLLTDLNFYLTTAIAILCISLFRKGIRSTLASRSLCIETIDCYRFTLANIALIILTISGIPTIMAFGFSSWLIARFSY